MLAMARDADLLAHDGGGCAARGVAELLERHGGGLDVDVDAIDERTAETREVTLHRAAADLIRGHIALGRGVHRRDEHEVRREAHGRVRSGDRDGLFFERLAERFENIARKLGEFVEEEDAVVREGDFAGARHRAATDDRGAGGGVVRGTDGADGDEAAMLIAGGHGAGGGVDARDFEGFVGRHRWEDAGEGAGHHGFAGAGGTEHDHNVSEHRIRVTEIVHVWSSASLGSS